MSNNMVFTMLINDPNLSEEQRKKEKEYKKYVDTHVDNVKKAWDVMKGKDDIKEYLKSQYDDVNYLYTIVDMQVKNHDASKYSIDEWEYYRKNFYPVDEYEKGDNVRDYETAKQHHYITNMHHWKWWADTNHQNDMPLNFVVEMCCDWIGVSMAFGKDALGWYKSQKDIVLGVKQKEWVESILTIYYK